MSMPANAATVTYEGGCSFNADTDPTGEIANPDTYTGAIVASVVATSDDPAANPVSVSVTCLLKVNGTVVDAPNFTGAGVAAGADDTSYVRHEGDVVELCDHVIAGGTDFGEVCGTADHFQIPPQEVIDAINEVFYITDPYTCEVLKVAFPPEGDIPDLGWDCPPYGI